ncbi:hypothetical protein FRC04_002360 [Tulasnella sp. 424]|nr:hypothetical protein FRC04_002360 [Tulasnella sp. 424]KAG8977433.1 hypothetical protein FRC05_001831 [Tulasnella sp. 425]
MKGYLITEYIKPSSLELQDIPEPVRKGPNDVIVEVYSGGLNYFDMLQVQGKYQNQPPFPWVPGTEFAGVISSSSTPLPDKCPFKVGDRVFGASQGAYAERMVCDWKALQKVPDGMSFDEAASLTITWPTSYEALVGRAQTQPGEWVLIHAAAGGVGLIAVQIAKALGAKVIATAGSQDKLDVCKKYGADELVNYRSDDWQKKVMQITGGKGVDVVFDPVGLVQKSLKVIGWKGRIVVVGFAAGTIEKIPMNLVLLKNISLVGLHWGAYLKHEPKRVPIVWKELIELYQKGSLKPVLYSKVFPLRFLAAGLAAIEDRSSYGKAHICNLQVASSYEASEAFSFLHNLCQQRACLNIRVPTTTTDLANFEAEMAPKRKDDDVEDDSGSQFSEVEAKETAPPPSKKAKTTKADKGKQKAPAAVSHDIQTNDNGEKFVQLSGKRRATVRVFKDAPMVDIREWYAKGGQTLPGGKGISLSVDQWEALKNAMSSIDEAIEAAKKA